MDQLICASFSHSHYWYEVGMLKVPGVMGVEVIKCNCQRVNSAVFWSLGISGAAACCKNKALGELMQGGSACRFYQPIRRQQRHAEGAAEAGGGPPPYLRAHQAILHEVIYILNFVFVLYLFILNSLVLVRVAAEMHEIFL